MEKQKRKKLDPCETNILFFKVSIKICIYLPSGRFFAYFTFTCMLRQYGRESSPSRKRLAGTTARTMV